MANITTQTIRVDLNTDRVMPTAFTHQNDTARTLVFDMYLNGAAYTMTGHTVKFAYISPKVNGQYSVIAGASMASGTVSGNKVSVTLPVAYTQISGVGMLTMIITPSSGTIRPVNIRLVVQKSADGADTVSGASDFPTTLEQIADNWYDENIADWLNENVETIFDAEAFGTAIDTWLDDHPEATTTVEDGSITYAKLNPSTPKSINNYLFGTSLAFGANQPELIRVHAEARKVETGEDSNVVLYGAYRLAGADYYEDYYTLQGGCYNSESDLFVLALVDSTFTNGIVVALDNSYNVVKRSEPLPIGHANDMTYNPNTGLIYVATGNSGTNASKLVVLDADTLAIDSVKSIGHEIWEISYDETNDVYYIYSTYIYIYDSSFNLIKRFTPKFETDETVEKLTTQTSFFYNGQFFIQSFSERTSGGVFNGIYINSFDEDGNIVSGASFVPYDSGYEPEAICVKDDVAYIFSGHVYFTVEKLFLKHGAIAPPNSDYYRAAKYAIAENDDLDDYIIFGKYVCPSSSIAASLTNCPTEYSGFTLNVHNTKGNEILQEIASSGGGRYEREYNPAANVWSEWKKVLLTEGLQNQTFSVSANSGSSTLVGTIQVPATKLCFISVTAEFPSSATGRRMLSIDNVWKQSQPAVDGDTTRITVTDVISNMDSNSGHYVNIRAYQNSGSSQTVSASVKYIFM